MCGIAGFWNGRHRSRDERVAIAAQMATAISRRGPDGEGFFDDGDGITLAHRRLAVVDLSPRGAQPMASASGQWVVTYNGELYNHVQLREQLEVQATRSMRGTSDTEVLVEAIEAWGVQAALERFDGMFAFAAWNRVEHTLMLAVDRFGEKPLYFGWCGHAFLFGSDLAALQAHPDMTATVCTRAVSALCELGYVPAPQSIFVGICKLMPGSFLRITRADLESRRLPQPVRYWDALETARQQAQKASEKSERSDAEWVDGLAGVLTASVRRQLQADVTVGAFLSSGIDSTSIVALAGTVSTRPIKTFTVGFEGLPGSEAPFAGAIARHLGTDHTEVHFTERDLLALVPELPRAYSEPFADASQLATLLVCRAARRQVTVALSGDAGDELFGGYDRYRAHERLAGSLNKIPLWARNAGSRALLALPAKTIDSATGLLSRVPGVSLPYQGIGDKVHKAARAFGASDTASLYEGLMTRWGSHSGLVLQQPAQGDGARSGIETPWPPPNQLSPGVPWMMGQDTVTYLPGDVLTKVDRAAMHESLETRVPFLDRHVFEYAWSMPMDLKIRAGVTKFALRRVLDRHVPKELMDRPKSGFNLPIDDWLRGPLRDWAADLLSPHALARDNLFNTTLVGRAWQRHLSGTQNLQQQLWPILMFQQWRVGRCGPGH